MNNRRSLLPILMLMITSPVFFIACCKEYQYNNTDVGDSIPAIRQEESIRMSPSLTAIKRADTLSIGIREMSPAVPVAIKIEFSVNNLNNIDTNLLKRYLRECDSIFLVPQRSKIFVRLDSNSVNGCIETLEHLCGVNNHIRIKGLIILKEGTATEEQAERLRRLGAEVAILPIERVNPSLQKDRIR